MDYRTLGSTGCKVSLLGMGGFHLLEISHSDADALLSRYLEAGGNYVETAARYGAGASERKLGRIGSARRKDFLLATKVFERTRKGAMASLEQSLKNLNTDYVDVWFMHAVQTPEEAEAITAPGGALEAALEARQKGMIRFIGLTGHGQPAGLIPAMRQYDFDVVMTLINYYDQFNYPDIADKLIPLIQSKGAGLIAMKFIADGYLWRSADTAMRFTLSQPVSHVVAGFNSMDMLEDDLAAVNSFEPLSDAELQAWYKDAPEFRGYVCRQCPACPAAESLDLKRIFELEGWFDRQMWDGKVNNPEDYSLRIRLAKWFGQQELARQAYKSEGHHIDPEADYGGFSEKCLYGLDLDRKLKIASAKLTGEFILG
jgi:aryl-alcohol dehydrogenase-like predicted oxidoreductase